MLPFKFLLVFGLLTGLVAEKCSLGDLGVADFSDQVTVTNASAVADVFVGVEFNHGQVEMYLPAGKSGTAFALAATKYLVTVVGPSDEHYESYIDRLLFLRDRLVEVTLSSKVTPDQIASAATELTLVQSALEQMNGSATVQSCGGTLEAGVTSQVTVKLTETTNGTRLWVLDCG